MQRLLEARVNGNWRDYIDSRSDLWTDLKPYLSALSRQKCWYCETKAPRFDYVVDHFRPKKRVRHANGTECEGYWWLAFDWHNYRLACDYCNSQHEGEDEEVRGKSDFFPLLHEDRRIHNPGDNLDDEMPLLLDPVVDGDYALLWFMQDGLPYPADEEGTFQYQRAETTIRLLNLKDERVAEARKALLLRCQRLIDRGEKTYLHYCNGSPAGMIEYKNICREIHELVAPDAEYSAAAKAFFKSSPLKWVRDLV